MQFPVGTPWNKRLKLVRQQREETQERVAEILGTSRRMIQRWEKGEVRPNPYSRRKLSEWAGVPENILFKFF